MACSSSSSSSLPTRPRKFDVYLSFRQEDTGGDFTDHLYNTLERKGIVAFRDDNRDMEEDTNEVILAAIETSKVAVVVVSENYGSSRRCLGELVKILECRNKMDMKVFPIYYKVDLDHVRSQTGCFGKAFVEHEAMYGEDNFEVKQWKKALIEIANLPGWVCNDWTHKPEVIKGICDALLKIIKPTFQEEISIRSTSSFNGFDYFKGLFGWLHSDEESSIYERMMKNERLGMLPQRVEAKPMDSQGGESSVIDIAHLDEIKKPLIQPSIKVRRGWEIRRHIVIGGLMESITSSVIITVATAANISTENILTLALTNLITGLFIIRHEISGLHEKENQIDKRYSRNKLKDNYYKKTMMEKMYYALNFIIAFLSFLGFGLVAPLVDALLSHQITDKNLKMIAVAGASLTCTIFLAIQKAHLLKPKSRDVYVKTATRYTCVGVVAFVISYLAGSVFGNLQQPLPFVF